MENQQQLKLTNFINKDFYHSTISINSIDHTKEILRELLNALDPKESEEHNKNLIRDFLIQIGYKFGQVNTSRRIDLSISNNGHNNVIIETKDFGNPQMLTTKNINHKAIHELILYFMREYLVHHNQHVTYLIATNGVEWFIFKASDFKKLFINDRKFVKEFEDSDVQHSLTDTSTNNFYKNIAKRKVAKVVDKIHYLHFDWSKEFHGKPISDSLATKVYKLFSPITMFKETYVEDSNALNVNFYNELLYIMGLREKKQSKGIERLPKDQRQQGSIVELIYYAINGSWQGKSPQHVFDDVINMAMSFIDRLLFLKLLESQLIKFNNNNKKYSFLNKKKIRSFSDVDDLFFKVLARPRKDRLDYLKKRYPYIPYLNSSLFEQTAIEKEYNMSPIRLRNTFELPLYKHSVLKGRVDKSAKGEKTLSYLIDFLNSYSFSANGRSFNNQELINSSVLGSIFEKINGYKDGAFFTPGFVTSYMAQTSIHKALINKFNRDGFHITKLMDLLNYDHSKVRKELNDFHLVDPAVGSGHFLVSALNYLVKIYYDLGLLTPRLAMYNITIKNDELLINNEALHQSFHYIRGSVISTEIQKSIFDTKKSIIENNLFGVDLNPNSVNIAKLRLWIELLKNSYYKGDNLVTMPNLEMNIKSGNSVINKYDIHENFSNVSSGTGIKVKDFKDLVNRYKNMSNKVIKHRMGHDIQEFKQNIINAINNNNARRNLNVAYQKYNSAKGSIELLSTKSIQRSREKIISHAKKNLVNAKYRWKLLNDNKIFHNSFEWRFEFPELLNNKGDFMGFDLVIANPPYLGMDNRHSEFERIRKSQLGRFSGGRMDIFYYFIHLAILLLNRVNGVLAFITTNYWLTDDFAKSVRSSFRDKTNILRIINFGNYKIFSSAKGQHNLIIEAEKGKYNNGEVKVAATKRHGNATPLTFNRIVSGDDSFTYYNKIKNDNIFDRNGYINLYVGMNTGIDDMANNLMDHYEPLSKHVEGKMGIQAVPNKAFVISKAKYPTLRKSLNQFELSSIKKLINGSSINDYFEHGKFDKYLIYTTNKTDPKKIPNLINYMLKQAPKIKKQGKNNKKKCYYALHRPRNIHILQSSDTIFSPHLSKKPMFMLNNQHFVVKNDARFSHIVDDKINKYVLLILLNSTLARFLWIYNNLVKGKEINIKSSSFNVIPTPLKDRINMDDVNAVIELMKIHNKPVQYHIDRLVNRWFNISQHDFDLIKKYVSKK